ncbi:uncharacterized protein LOC133818848 isoform X2 [Humulus lupulus]|uniref:uncharacterized protein LOC133818848 isoform X2 n=1 Tax=Humulus lupulus TaxID=3486 RepID=UPI002B404BB6|nr:uncharacterized protein LOC133818848 isoform X2 [Humulus lupulus]
MKAYLMFFLVKFVGCRVVEELSIGKVVGGFDMNDVVGSICELYCRLENLEKEMVEVKGVNGMLKVLELGSIVGEDRHGELNYDGSYLKKFSGEVEFWKSSFDGIIETKFDPMIMEFKIGVVDNKYKRGRPGVDKVQTDKLSKVQTINGSRDGEQRLWKRSFGNMIELYNSTSGLKVGTFSLTNRLSEEDFSSALYVFDPEAAVPVIYLVNNHWILVVIDLKKNFATIWDSFEVLSLHMQKHELLIAVVDPHGERLAIALELLVGHNNLRRCTVIENAKRHYENVLRK